MSFETQISPKVFISYSHDSIEHKRRVRNLSDRLRREGIDSNIDQYEQSPSEGWPRWMERQIEEADFVLVVCTETYERRFRGVEEPGRGLGGSWEGRYSISTCTRPRQEHQFYPCGIFFPR